LILLQNTHFLFFFSIFVLFFFFMWNPHCVVEITKTT
jgi:hypothetical protein